MKVFYAERGSDADTRIERLVESSTDPRGIKVVTSDRRLAQAVRSCKAEVIRSGEFRKQVEQALAARPSAEDGEQFEIDDVNAWLRYFGALPTDDE